MKHPRHLDASVARRPGKRHGQRRLNGIGRKQCVRVSRRPFGQQLQPLVLNLISGLAAAADAGAPSDSPASAAQAINALSESNGRRIFMSLPIAGRSLTPLPLPRQSLGRLPTHPPLDGTSRESLRLVIGAPCDCRLRPLDPDGVPANSLIAPQSLVVEIPSFWH